MIMQTDKSLNFQKKIKKIIGRATNVIGVKSGGACFLTQTLISKMMVYDTNLNYSAWLIPYGLQWQLATLHTYYL